jgi:hypothetical protein
VKPTVRTSWYKTKDISFCYHISFSFSPSESQIMKVAVIGGGPSGLVTLKYLVIAHNFLPVEPIEACLFESEAQIGGTFRYRTYEDAEVRCQCCIALVPNTLSLTA